MKKGFIYISILAAAVLASCVKNPVGERTLSGTGEKTPIDVNLMAAADNNSTGTKAAGREFVQGDQFVAYLRHVTWNGGTSDARNLVDADKSPVLVTFTKGSAAMATFGGSDITPIGTNVALGLNSGNTKQTSDLTASPALYWDDFSNSASADTDLRTSGHYLESFYGYCYNGSPAYGDADSSISTPLVETTGVLGWTVLADQSTSDAFKHSDLLWSAEQEPVAYNHAKDRPGLVLPFTHAMSKVTVVVKCGDGFEADATKNFGSAVVTLKGMNKSVSLTAPTMNVATFETNGDVIMQKLSEGAEDKQRSFNALVAPTLLKEGKEFITINGIDGNNYKLVLSDAVIDAKEGEPAETKADAWSTKLVAHDLTEFVPSTPAGYTVDNGGITRPGVNYLITVTINKQEITVKATITNWENVTAEGVGEIQFNGDITGKGSIATELQTNGFAIYQSGVNTSADPIVPSGYSQASVWSYTGEPAAWTATPKIYWPNGADKFYFRALSGYDPANAFNMSQDRDVLWATTQAHEGPDPDHPALTFAEGDPIAPRTGDVPLVFYHPMTKVTVNLVDANKDTPLPEDVEADDYDNPLNPRLDLTEATVHVTNIATTGKIELHEGNITPGDAANRTQIATYADKSSINIPQTITDDAALIVTLNNGATYKLQLNTCIDADEDPITEWVRGKHYTYTITLSKESITFRALIKDWIETTGGGNANLEWD